LSKTLLGIQDVSLEVLTLMLVDIQANFVVCGIA
jgi:hypothetical protein